MTETPAQAQHTAALPGVPSGTWRIDPAHSVVGFAVRHLMSKVRGRFNEFTGHITVADNRVESAAQVEIALASVDTGNDMRDNDLRSNNFLGVDAHPTMTFASTRLHQAEESWVLDGTLTIRGTTRPVNIDLEFLGFDPTGAQGEPRIGFAGRTSINRSDFGISFGLGTGDKVVVGDRIDIDLDVEAVLL